MANIEILNGGRSGARDIPVWDPAVRLIHWSVALAVLFNSFSDGEGALHAQIGYIAAGLVAIRLVLGLVGQGHARFGAFPPSLSGAVGHVREILGRSRKIHLSHNPLGALMAYNLWGTLAVLALTGYMMSTPAYFGVEWVEELHEIAYSWLLLSVALHIGGILIDTLRTGVPLVRAMVTGKKRIPDGADLE